MKLFKRGEQERARIAQQQHHEAEQDERLARIEAEVRALSAYVRRQPDLKAVTGK